MIKYLLDTDVLIRFLRSDHPEHSPAAKNLFEKASDGECALILTEMVLAEAVLVLHSVYDIERFKVATGLRKVIMSAGVRCMRRDEIIDALDLFASTDRDFHRCFLTALAKTSGDPVATFEHSHFKNVQTWFNNA